VPLTKAINSTIVQILKEEILVNLWQVFPETLLQAPNILNFSYFTLVLYVVILAIAVKHKSQRKSLLIFLLASLLVSIYLIMSMRLGMEKVLPPLMLLLIIFVPVVKFCLSVVSGERANIKVWLLTVCASFSFALSWFVWILALTGS